MAYRVAVSDAEINALLGKCIEQASEGGSKYPGMSFEEGIQQGIEWVLGESEQHPLDD